MWILQEYLHHNLKHNDNEKNTIHFTRLLSISYQCTIKGSTEKNSNGRK
jgi:hypothetical protein